MKKIFVAFFAVVLAVAPMSAQSKKIIRQAKSDAKYELSQLKDRGYNTIDNVKLDDAVTEFLTAKYSDKSLVESVGKAVGMEDLNEAKAQARREAVGAYPEQDVYKTMFVYHKNRKKYDVICYALVGGASAPMAQANPSQFARKDEGSDALIAQAKAEEAQKEAKIQAKKDKAKAKKEAKKDAKKAEAKAKKDAQKAYDKAYNEALGRQTKSK